MTMASQLCVAASVRRVTAPAARSLHCRSGPASPTLCSDIECTLLVEGAEKEEEEVRASAAALTRRKLPPTPGGVPS
eukprot:3496666-Rhodomonas_salina.2